METLRWFLEGLLGLLLDFIAGMGEVAVSLNSEFAWGLPAGVARFGGILIAALLLGGGIARLLLWRPRFNRAQVITLTTAQTPRQVLSQDLSNLLWVIVRLVAVLVVLWLVLSARG